VLSELRDFCTSHSLFRDIPGGAPRFAIAPDDNPRRDGLSSLIHVGRFSSHHLSQNDSDGDNPSTKIYFKSG